MISEPDGNGKPMLIRALPRGPPSSGKASEADAAQGFAKRLLRRKMTYKQKLLKPT